MQREDPPYVRWTYRSPHLPKDIHQAPPNTFLKWIDEQLTDKRKMIRPTAESVCLALGLMIRDLTLNQFSLRDPDDEQPLGINMPSYMTSIHSFSLIDKELIPRCISLTKRLGDVVSKPSTSSNNDNIAQPPGGRKRK